MTMLEDVANDLAVWIDQTASEVALAFTAGGHAPFAAPVTEEQKLEYYKNQLFNPDGTPNAAGRDAQIARLGQTGFGQVYRAVIAAYPQLKIPAPPPLAVPEQWPSPGPLAAPPPGPVAPTGPMGPPAPPGNLGGPPGPPPLPGRAGLRAMASGGIVTQPTVALIGEAGPEAVVPLGNYQPPPYQPGVQESLGRVGQGASDPTAVAPAPSDIQNYIDQAARARGIDPAVAMAVAYNEGGRDPSAPGRPAFSDPAVRGTFPTGSSWWPFQLHYGGQGYEQYGNTAGLGNEFTQQTGFHPGDPAAWKPSVDFALDTALKRGWYPTWYGSKPAGVTAWQGIPRSTA